MEISEVEAGFNKLRPQKAKLIESDRNFGKDIVLTAMRGSLQIYPLIIHLIESNLPIDSSNKCQS